MRCVAGRVPCSNNEARLWAALQRCDCGCGDCEHIMGSVSPPPVLSPGLEACPTSGKVGKCSEHSPQGQRDAGVTLGGCLSGWMWGEPSRPTQHL